MNPVVIWSISAERVIERDGVSDGRTGEGGSDGPTGLPQLLQKT